MSAKYSQITRRKVLLGGSTVAMASWMSACCRITTLKPCALTAPLAPPLVGDLAIDVHTHVFNGTDLQVKEFISRNVDLSFNPTLAKIAGTLVQFLTWNLAPTGCDEYKELNELADCRNASERAKRIAMHRGKGYESFAAEARKSSVYMEYKQRRALAQKSMRPPALNERSKYVDAIGYLLDGNNLQEFQDRQLSLSSEKTLNGISFADVVNLLKFLSKGFNYRYENYLDYLDTYNAESYKGRSIDLMIANLVDYDWPLAKGKATKTPFRDQVAVMERLSLFAHGRIHGFVPFDPMRQAAIAAGKKPEKGKDSHFTFDEVKDAVLSRGFIGVKLYPVMGFLPTGNASVNPDVWAVEWLPGWMRNPIPVNGVQKKFGELLDEALDQLYAWAEKNEVPITSHTDPTQGPSRLFDWFTISQNWSQVLAKYPNLRLNFAHSGSPTGPGDASGNVFPFITAAGSKDHFVYGDLSYAAGALSNPQGYGPLLENLFQKKPEQDGAYLQDRLMYGTDWLMLLNAQKSEQCLSISEAALKYVDASPKLPHEGSRYADRFFALNAVRFLGLKQKQKTRERLEAFYKKNGLDYAADPPAWMKKVDAL